MNRIRVHSSNIHSVGYDPESRLLEIEFVTGGIYQYAGVPEEEWRGLMQASSHGSYFQHNIKDRYAFKRII